MLCTPLLLSGAIDETRRLILKFATEIDRSARARSAARSVRCRTLYMYILRSRLLTINQTTMTPTQLQRVAAINHWRGERRCGASTWWRFTARMVFARIRNQVVLFTIVLRLCCFVPARIAVPPTMPPSSCRVVCGCMYVCVCPKECAISWVRRRQAKRRLRC